MVTNPNIILSGNQMAQPRLPDVNAMMQTRTAGLEKVYGIEQQRAEQARVEQEAQEAAAAEAMLPSVMAAYKNPSDAGLDQAVSLMPAEVRDTFAPFVARLKAIPDPATRRAVLESELAKDAGGRAVLERVMTPYQEATLGVQRGQLELSKAELAQRRAEAEAEAQRPAAGDFATVETDQGIFIINKKTGEMVPATTGAPAVGEGPIDVGQPPQVLQSAAKGKETAEEVKKRLAEEKRAKDVKFAIGELENAMKEGGLIDQATGSYLGNLIDTAVQLFPVATYGAVANARMKPIADLALKLVPRFEGPQSDKDTQSYKDAAGDLANPNLAPSVKKAAADQIVSLLKKYNGQFEYSGGGAGGNVIDFNDLGD